MIVKQRYILMMLLLAAQHGFAVNIIMGPNGCTLKDHIRSASADAPRGNCSAGSGNDVIIAPDNWVVVVDQLLPAVTTAMTIKPSTEQGQFFISGDESHRVFDVTGQSADLTLHRVTLYDAKSELFDGAAIKIIDGQ